MLTKTERSKINKKNRRLGKDFENAVREDLERKGWIVIRWDKNIQLNEFYVENKNSARMVQAKPKFIPGIGLVMNSPGFPDYICLKRFKPEAIMDADLERKWIESREFEAIFVECKLDGTTEPIEKEKADWLIRNLKIDFYIARKPKDSGELATGEKIVYQEIK